MQCLPASFVTGKGVSGCRWCGCGTESGTALAALLTTQMMPKRAKLSVPAPQQGISPKPNGIEDMLSPTGATHAQVRLVLRQIAEAVEPGIGRHVKAEAASAVRR